MRTIIDFFTPQVFAILGFLLTLNIISNITRYYIARYHAKLSMIELEKTMQESEARLEKIVSDMEVNRSQLMSNFQTITNSEIVKQQQEMLNKRNSDGSTNT